MCSYGSHIRVYIYIYNSNGLQPKSDGLQPSGFQPKSTQDLTSYIPARSWRFPRVLRYLDAKERKFIEEFSVCNFVGITKAGPDQE